MKRRSEKVYYAIPVASSDSDQDETERKERSEVNDVKDVKQSGYPT
eukprot:CAMPEP_0174833380 /NCGR_PEP_ID=MMETSP1114-20130205/4205_1 /TAXON_ID=312471 /ORGANISM="Neobodo designis, Strain CCAP 1951/1" /LENGTH=45 /DNA_ID= /DNA_START= /DNA_END= /DNA_ORIENTATION=